MNGSFVKAGMRFPWMLADRRVFVFCGHFGSGKSEVSVNFAEMLARAQPTAIADFDIINPYFRSSDARAELESAGVRVIAPRYAGTNVDVPAVPAEARSLFDDESMHAVFDVGGDDLGARAVSSFHDHFSKAGAAHVFVYNAKRPTTSTPGKAAAAFRDISLAARMPFDAIACNANLLEKTSAEDLDAGLDGALELSGLVGAPIAFCAVMGSDGVAPGPMPDPGRPLLDGLAELPRYAEPFAARAASMGIPTLVMRKRIRMP